MNTIYKIQTYGNFKERTIIRGFKTRDDMFKFLNKGDNALFWKETKDKKDLCGDFLDKLKPGTYARAGSKLHNVKHLDPVVLAHI